MNHIYKVVWSETKHAYVVGSEFVSSVRGKRSYKTIAASMGTILERAAVMALLTGSILLPAFGVSVSYAQEAAKPNAQQEALFALLNQAANGGTSDTSNTIKSTPPI